MKNIVQGERVNSWVNHVQETLSSLTDIHVEIDHSTTRLNRSRISVLFYLNRGHFSIPATVDPHAVL